MEEKDTNNKFVIQKENLDFNILFKFVVYFIALSYLFVLLTTYFNFILILTLFIALISFSIALLLINMLIIRDIKERKREKVYLNKYFKKGT